MTEVQERQPGNDPWIARLTVIGYFTLLLAIIVGATIMRDNTPSGFFAIGGFLCLRCTLSTLDRVQKQPSETPKDADDQHSH